MLTYSAVRSSRGRGMAGTALIRLLTCDSISRTLRLVDSCLDAIWSMTRGMSTWRKRSSLTSSVNPSAVRALLSAASSSASVGAGDAISDALRFRSVVTITTFAIRPVFRPVRVLSSSKGSDLTLDRSDLTSPQTLTNDGFCFTAHQHVQRDVPAIVRIPVSTPRGRRRTPQSHRPRAVPPTSPPRPFTHSTLFERASLAPL